MMKRSIIVSGIFLLLLLLIIPPVSAEPIWTSASGCWTNTSGNFTIVMWNATGNSTWFIPLDLSSLEVLIIGGGGSSGGGVAGAYAAGGGGAGGWLNGTVGGLTLGTNVNITVGSGGSAVASGTLGNNGTSSLFSTYIAYGGGGGGAGKSSATPETYGMPGGSSGGSAKTGATSYPSTQTNQGELTGYGYKGGDGDNKGGGGAGGTTSSPAGGAGKDSSMSGTVITYAKGGHAGGAVAGTLTGLGYGGNLTSGGVTSNAGGSGVVIVKYDTATIPPIARFKSNITVGITSIPVQFNDTSLIIPTSWNWSFKNITGNNTDVWFSQSQNPSYIFGTGNWLITLNATNSVGSNISTQVTFINVTKNCSDGGAYSTWVKSGDTWVRTNSFCIVKMWNTTGNTTWTRPINLTEIEYLLVAGGGGSSAFGGGGGGAGGYLVNNLTPINDTTINISVGDGGAGGIIGVNSGLGVTGQNSSFGTFLTYGGGTSGNDAVGNGASGRGGYGSGGGAGTWVTGTGTGGTSAGQGNAGGNQGSQSNKGGGGGGAGGAGVAGNVNSRGGDGGVGLQNNITGTLTYYAGGGGGGVRQGSGVVGGYAGAGGGGNGSGTSARDGTNGTPGTGGGAGGSRGYTDTTAPGYKGGSGVVIIRYDITTDSSSPTAFFTSNVTNGLSPLSVQFTDTSVFAPTSWNWSFKNVNENNTQVWFSQLQNPSYIFGIGNWLITLNATNSLGTNISTQVTFINVTPNCSIGGVYSEWGADSGSWVKTNSLCIVRMWNTTGNTTWIPTSNLTIEYLIVAGGGGSSAFGGGGGGAGGYLWGNFSPVNNNISINISVGDGGAGGVIGVNSGLGIAGQNSSFGTFLAYGGGTSGNDAVGNGASGRGGYGSGGGAGTWATGTGTGGTSAGQGNAGGNQGSQANKGGGGGGAGGAGVAGNVNSRGGDGGVGLQNNITGTLTYYAGGGGGGVRQGSGVVGGYAGAGGGGNGSGTSARDGTNGTPGTGGGAGGSRGYTDTTAPGYKGGSGVVIIRYAIIPSSPTSTFTSNVTTGLSPLSVQFNDTSVFTPTSWNWSFKDVTGNNTEIWFSQSQNPSYTFGIGNFLIRLNATNGVGSNISTQITFINVTQDCSLGGVYSEWGADGGSWVKTNSLCIVRMWNTTGNTTWTPPTNVTQVDYLVIGGGGGGGLQNAGNAGGGGAGGFRNSIRGEKSGNNSVNEITLPVTAGENYTVTVGAGGTENLTGNNSVFGTIISLGGGNGGKYYGTSTNGAGAGGSGGGAGQVGSGTYIGASGSITQGTSGGNSAYYSAAGGGGSSNVGQAAQSNTVGGKGGNGTWSNITGVNTTYAGGGGGSTHNSGSTVAIGGTGGGGNGHQGVTAATAGTVNTGSGGGGGGEASVGAAGGSGIVIIRYAIIPSSPTSTFTSNVTTGLSPLSVQFNDTSVFTPTSWNWSFTNVSGNNTEVWFSQSQNPSYIFGIGNFSIKLNTSNEFGSTISPQVTFINVTNPPEVFDAITYGNFTDFIINSTFNLTDYQVMMNLSNSTGYTSSPRLFYTNGTTRADWLDVAFTDTSNVTLGFWKENKTETSTNSTWWIKVPTIANNNTTRIRMFYGNLSKTLTYMNGDNTFIIFDDFVNSSFNTTKWTSSGGTPSVSNGNLTIPAGTTVSMKTTTSINLSVMSVMSDNNYGFSYFPIFGWGSGGNAMIVTWGADPGPAIALWVRDAGAGGRTNIGTGNPLNNIFYKYEIIRNGTTSAIATIANRSTIARTTELPTGSQTVQLAASNSGTTHNITADWIALRKYNHSEPFLTPYVTTVRLTTSFTSNVTNGTLPLPVQFNDTSSATNIPTSWNWSFKDVIGNNTEIWFSQLQNPSYVFGIGNFSIKLNSSNSLETNISTQITFINVSQDCSIGGAYGVWSVSGDSWIKNNTVCTVRMWNATGSYNWLATNNITSVEYLIVGGGGGEATTCGGMYGEASGGGEVLSGLNNSISGTLTLEVGGSNTNSSFGSIISRAGHKGGTDGGYTCGYGGYSGDGIHAGGSGAYPVQSATGGGGGAGANGSNVIDNLYGANGGNGLQNNITGTLTYYGGGAGGSGDKGIGYGGLGGGGNGQKSGGVIPTAGTNGTGGGGSVDKLGGSGTVIIRYLNPLTTDTPVLISSFTSNVTNGTPPLSVQFNDTSTFTIAPTSWNWSFKDVSGNNTEIWFSQSQNATYIFGIGNFSIKLNSSNSLETNISTQITFINVSQDCSIGGAYGVWSVSGDSWIKNNTVCTVRMWNATGSHTWSSTNNITSVEYLVVGGGGGEATTCGGMYGVASGGGEVLSGLNNSISGTLTLEVGGSNINSSLGGIIARSGHKGGTDGGYTCGYGGYSGDGIHAGGSGAYPVQSATGGGGGAGANGSNVIDNLYGANGGNGLQNNITGTLTYYGGGAGGSGDKGIGYGGNGGGGNGQKSGGVIPTAGTNGTGGGGSVDKLGGSGVTIVRYLTPFTTDTTPVASFTVTKNFIRIPTSIIVNDTSTNTPTSWDWSWGDGTANSNTQNSSHTYLKRGQWNITLTVTNAGGSNATSTLVRVIGYDNNE